MTMLVLAAVVYAVGLVPAAVWGWRVAGPDLGGDVVSLCLVAAFFAVFWPALAVSAVVVGAVVLVQRLAA